MKKSLPPSEIDIINETDSAVAVEELPENAEGHAELGLEASELSASIDRQVEELLDFGFNDQENSLIPGSESSATKAELEDIDEEAEVIGDEARRTIAEVIKDKTPSSLGKFIAGLKARFEAIKKTRQERREFRETMQKHIAEWKTQEKEDQKKNGAKHKVVDKNPVLHEALWERKLDDYSLSALQLFAKNPYLNILEFNPSHTKPEIFNQVFQEASLKSFADFFPDVKYVDEKELEFFVLEVTPLSENLLAFIKKSFLRSKKTSFGDFIHDDAIEALKSYDDEELIRLQKFIDKDSAYFYSYFGFHGSTFDHLKALKEKIEFMDPREFYPYDSSDFGQERFQDLCNLSESEFAVFQNLLQLAHESKDYRTDLKYVFDLYNLAKEVAGTENVQAILDWAKSIAGRNDMVAIKRVIKNCLVGRESPNSDRDIEVTPELLAEPLTPTSESFAEKLRQFGDLSVLKILTGIEQREYMSEPMTGTNFADVSLVYQYLEDFEADPKKTLIEKSSPELFSLYSELKGFLDSKGIIFDENDQNQIIEGVLQRGESYNPIRQTEFPFSQEARKYLVERFIAEKPDLCYTRFDDFKKYLEAITDATERQSCLKQLLNMVIDNYPIRLLGRSSFPIDELLANPEINKNIIETLISKRPDLCYTQFDDFKKYLEAISDPAEKQSYLKQLLTGVIDTSPVQLFYESSFPIDELLADPEINKNIVETLVADYRDRCYTQFDVFKKYLEAIPDPSERQFYLDRIFNTIMHNSNYLLSQKNDFPFTKEQLGEIGHWLALSKPNLLYEKFNEFKKYWEAIPDPAKRQLYLDAAFHEVKSKFPALLLEPTEFPLTEEQGRFVALIKRIGQSQSKELKNMADEIASIVAKESSFKDSEKVIEKIERIFLRNNVPFIGKQFKIFEILYPDKKLDEAISRSYVPSFKENHSNNSRRLVIFKDLLQTSFDSLNTNLEQYLLILKDGKIALEKFEAGESLSDEEKTSLQSFLKKINALAEAVGREPIGIDGIFDEQTARDEIESLRKSFGARNGETIIQRFERTFLKRIGIASFEDAIGYFEAKRSATDERNRAYAKSGQIELEETDLVKGVYSRYFIDTMLDRGIFSPEFIGADSSEAKNKSKFSDGTTFDTDTVITGPRNLAEVASKSMAASYGDLMVIIKDRGQFTSGKGKLELVDIGPEQKGIRTGFGSSYIEGLIARDSFPKKEMDGLKFAIAKKGFYIPITDSIGKVIFSAEEYDNYRQIFSGIDRYHGEPIQVDHEWQASPYVDQIREYAQTEEKIKTIDEVRQGIFNDVAEALRSQGIRLSEGKYAESILGAGISDTGSTGRGSALDEGYDFDFAVKLDDEDFEKCATIADILTQKYHFNKSYEQTGMRMYRSEEMVIDGRTISLDIGFVKKSNVEAFDTNTAISEKYDWIKEHLGETAYLEVMTNIRFAKKTLKGAKCYKKGFSRGDGQQGGMGGIGVEHWILQHHGDAIEAFRAFYESAYQHGDLVPFKEFQEKYKIFSAGENIRNNMKAENFVYNMDEEGYKAMAELAKKVASGLPLTE